LTSAAAGLSVRRQIAGSALLMLVWVSQGAIAPMPQISGESHYFSGLTWFESARQILWSVEK
jgi:hypothetical protein